MIKLRNKDLQTLTNIFSQVHEPIEVWAFGSRVTGEAHDGSDLDLVIKTPDGKKLAMETFRDLKQKIIQSNIPIIVQLFDWARLPESIHKNIEAGQEILFSNVHSEVKEPVSDYKIKESNK